MSDLGLAEFMRAIYKWSLNLERPQAEISGKRLQRRMTPFLGAADNATRVLGSHVLELARLMKREIQKWPQLIGSQASLLCNTIK